MTYLTSVKFRFAHRILERSCVSWGLSASKFSDLADLEEKEKSLFSETFIWREESLYLFREDFFKSCYLQRVTGAHAVKGWDMQIALPGTRKNCNSLYLYWPWVLSKRGAIIPVSHIQGNEFNQGRFVRLKYLQKPD